MLQIATTLHRAASIQHEPEARPKADPVTRCVQFGLMIYLTPVILLVAIIGGASLAAQAAGRIVYRAGSDVGESSLALDQDPESEKSRREGSDRRHHAVR